MKLVYCYTSIVGTDWYAWIDIAGKITNGYYTLAQCRRYFPTVVICS